MNVLGQNMGGPFGRVCCATVSQFWNITVEGPVQVLVFESDQEGEFQW